MRHFASRPYTLALVSVVYHGWSLRKDCLDPRKIFDLDMVPSSVIDGIWNRIEAGLDVVEVAEEHRLWDCRLCTSLVFLLRYCRKDGPNMADNESHTDIGRCGPMTSRRCCRTNMSDLVVETYELLSSVFATEILGGRDWSIRATTIEGKERTLDKAVAETMC